MSRYQITLTPVDKFFFGGDMTFQVGADENDEINAQFKSYIIQSSRFPQQTSLLGMLRFLVVSNAGRSVFKDGQIVDKGEAKKLIGGHGFSVNKDGHPRNDFGTIKSLSRIKIRRSIGENVYNLEVAPLFGSISFDGSSTGTYNLKEFIIPDIPKEVYDAKKNGISVALTDGKDTFAFEDIFIEDRRIGIARDLKTGKTGESALFKQISYRFNNKWATHCFAFQAEVDDRLPLEKYNGQMVSVGADNSQFIIGITKEESTSAPENGSPTCVCLLSPTFLLRQEAQLASFAVTSLMPFRFLETSIEAKSYHILNKELKRSSKYMLYAPGSVFYFQDEERKKEFVQAIEGKEDFRQIGYNEYK